MMDWTRQEEIAEELERLRKLRNEATRLSERLSLNSEILKLEGLSYEEE